MPDLVPWAWALLVLAALNVGISKTAIPGGGILSVALFASVLPARTSTAALLLLLIVGDVFAVIVYRKHAHWPTLLRLAPAVVAGLIVGFFFLAYSDDAIVRRTIGIILLLMIAITLWRRRSTATVAQPGDHERPRRLLSATYGTLGGFTTMVANAGGPVMSMYFLATRAPLHVFLGTAAWFFAVVNLVKVPMLAGLGLVNVPVLVMDAVLVPFVIVGALVGMRMANRMNQQFFDRLVISLTVIGAVYLLI